MFRVDEIIKRKVNILWGKLPRCWYYQVCNKKGWYTQHYIWVFGRKWNVWKWWYRWRYVNRNEER